MRPDYILDGKPAILQISVGAHVNRFKVVEERASAIPRGVVRPVHHVVAKQGADWNELDVGDVEARREVLVGLDDFIEAFFAVAHQVHLVYAHHDVPQAE